MRDIAALPASGRVTVDTAPLIYLLEGHPRFASRYGSFFERAEEGHYELVIATMTLAEVLAGPLRTGNETLAQQYRRALTSPPTWRVAALSASIADRATRLRGEFKLRMPDAVQVATALETESIALVTCDRDFSALADRLDPLGIYG